jgi:hypothetical protein
VKPGPAERRAPAIRVRIGFVKHTLILRALIHQAHAPMKNGARMR